MIFVVVFVIALVSTIVLAQGALVWLIASMAAPAQKDFSLWRGILVGLLMSLAGIAISVLVSVCQTLIKSRWVSDWEILAQYLGTVVVIWVGFRLSFSRTILVTTLFWAAVMGIFLLAWGGIASG